MATTASSNSTAADLDEDLEPVANETAEMAQRVVASYSNDAEECRTLLDMLGIGPSTSEDDEE